MTTREGESKRWRRWLVIGAVQLAVVVLLAELAVRLVAPRNRGLRMLLTASTDTMDFSDAESLAELMNRTMLGFSPGTVEYGFVLNSRSFRTREYELDPAADRFRVVALGDSFTFASGALPHEDHWTTLTEEQLGRRVNRSVEVLRLGVPDTGPAFQLRLWQLEAGRLEPDVVVLGFFVGNDFVDHQGDGGVFGGHARGFVGRLVSVSALYRVSRNLIRVSGASEGAARSSAGGADGLEAGPGQPVPGYRETFDPDLPTFDREQFVAIESHRMALCLRSEEEAFSGLASRVIPVVQQLVSRIEDQGARCIVMVIPDQYQVDDGLVDAILGATGHQREDYDLDRPQRELVGALESSGAEVLDLLPVFRRASDGGTLYRPRDTHWNRRGNQAAAMALTDVLLPHEPATAGSIFSDSLESRFPGAWTRVVDGQP